MAAPPKPPRTREMMTPEFIELIYEGSPHNNTVKFILDNRLCNYTIDMIMVEEKEGGNILPKDRRLKIQSMDSSGNQRIDCYDILQIYSILSRNNEMHIQLLTGDKRLSEKQVDYVMKRGYELLQENSDYQDELREQGILTDSMMRGERENRPLMTADETLGAMGLMTNADYERHLTRLRDLEQQIRNLKNRIKDEDINYRDKQFYLRKKQDKITAKISRMHENRNSNVLLGLWTSELEYLRINNPDFIDRIRYIENNINKLKLIQQNYYDLGKQIFHIQNEHENNLMIMSTELGSLERSRLILHDIISRI